MACLCTFLYVAFLEFLFWLPLVTDYYLKVQDEINLCLLKLLWVVVFEHNEIPKQDKTSLAHKPFLSCFKLFIISRFFQMYGESFWVPHGISFSPVPPSIKIWLKWKFQLTSLFTTFLLLQFCPYISHVPILPCKIFKFSFVCLFGTYQTNVMLAKSTCLHSLISSL